MGTDRNRNGKSAPRKENLREDRTCLHLLRCHVCTSKAKRISLKVERRRNRKLKMSREILGKEFEKRFF